MRTPIRKNTHARPAENDFRTTKQRLQQARWKAKINGITNAEIPDRNELDYFGNTFDGISRMKLAFRGITEEEQAENSTTNFVLASHVTDSAQRAVGTNHIKEDSIENVHQKENSTTQFVLASHNSDDNQRAVGPDHIKNTTLESRHFKNSVVRGDHISDSQIDARHFKTRAVKAKKHIDWSNRSVPKNALTGIDWKDVDHTPQIVDRNYLRKREQSIKQWVNRRISRMTVESTP